MFEFPDLASSESFLDNELSQAEWKEKLHTYTDDATGLTPLQMLLKEKMNIFEQLKKSKPSKNEPSIDDINTKSVIIDKLMYLYLEDDTIEYDSPDEIGLTSFHAACTMSDTPLVECISNTVSDINHKVNENSSLWPGFTAAHFAAHFNAKMVMMLISKGADLMIEDAKGTRAFDICIKSFNRRDLHSIMVSVPAWRTIRFSDRKTNLLRFIDSLCDEYRFDQFWKENNQSKYSKIPTLPADSLLWPGSTFLHIAVILLKESSVEMIDRILKVNTKAITMADSNGSTPVHLAFREQCWVVLDLLLHKHKQSVNPVDRENLSHLHIAAAANKLPLVKRLVNIGANSNLAFTGTLSNSALRPGWTPLHVAVHKRYFILSRTLLDNGADLLQTDVRGFTAVHLLLGITVSTGAKKVASLLLASKKLEERVVEGLGLTHLHAACYHNHIVAMDRLLNLGSDIEAPIGKDEELEKFEGYKPLHLVRTDEASRKLVSRGADVFSLASDGFSPLITALYHQHYSRDMDFFISMIANSDELFQQRMQERLGLTLLHVACLKPDLGKIQALLDRGIDVNVKINDKSAMWPGFTALHLLAYAGINQIDNLSELFKIMLNRGADVCSLNALGNTPIHVILGGQFTSYGLTPVKMLLGYYREYHINVENPEGVSFFHVACLTYDVDTAQQFLLHNKTININFPVKPCSERFAGQSPLHLTLVAEARRVFGAKLQHEMINFLLDHGANVHAVDAHGWSILHYISRCGPKRMGLLNRIDRPYELDMHGLTKDCETPFEILLRHGGSIQEIEYFANRGSCINGHNTVTGIGYMALVIATEKYKYSYKNIIEFMMNRSDITQINPSGRNAFHNAVACKKLRPIELQARTEAFYITVFDRLVELGCNINHRDAMGRTPLHLAVEFGNDVAVPALLICGADVNVTDNTGIPPLEVSLKADAIPELVIMRFLCLFLMKLQALQLKVDESNVKVLNELVTKHGVEYFDFNVDNFQRQVEHTKGLKIGKVIMYTFHHILIDVYTSKAAVESFLQFCKHRNFENIPNELQFLFRIRHKMLSGRLPLLEPCRYALKVLFKLPDLCLCMILKLLGNADMKSLIAAAMLEK